MMLKMEQSMLDDSADIMKVDTQEITQEVVFNDSRNLKAFEIMFRQTGYSRNERSFLYFCLYDPKGHCIWEDKIGMTEIGNTKEGKVLRLNMKNVPVEDGKTYTLNIGRADLKSRMNMEAYVCLDKNQNLKYNFR